MNLKNVAIWTSVLLLVVGFGLIMQNAVVEMQESSYVTFSDASVAYINELYSAIETSNMENVTEQSVTSYQNDSIFLTEEGEGGTDVTDVLAQLNFFKTLNQKYINPIRFIFNIPTFLLTLFGVPLEPFSAVTTILNFVIYVGLITMIIVQLRGS